MGLLAQAASDNDTQSSQSKRPNPCPFAVIDFIPIDFPRGIVFG